MKYQSMYARMGKCTAVAFQLGTDCLQDKKNLRECFFACARWFPNAIPHFLFFLNDVKILKTSDTSTGIIFSYFQSLFNFYFIINVRARKPAFFLSHYFIRVLIMVLFLLILKMYFLWYRTICIVEYHQ